MGESRYGTGLSPKHFFVVAVVTLVLLVCVSLAAPFANQAHAAKLSKQYKANIYHPQTSLKDAPLVVWGGVKLS